MHIEKGRVGEFFLFVGLILLILFAGAGQAGATQLEFLCLSLITFALAFWLIWKDWKAPAPRSRFGLSRKSSSPKAEQKGKKS
jgi:hypothetical protein